MRKLAWAALALFGCDEKQFVGECGEGLACAVGFDCRAGLCVCRSDESCKAGEFCNNQGICQIQPGCRSSAECAADKFCDLSSGRCLLREVQDGSRTTSACGLDAHCPPGWVCDPEFEFCVAGCRDDGDCPLYGLCERGAGTSSAALGTCGRGTCLDKTFCELGERCDGGRCVADPSVNCQACANRAAGECGTDGSACVVNVNYDAGDPSQGTEFFCASACEDQDDCPFGFACGPLTQLLEFCTSEADCDGLPCFKGEGQARGNCACGTNADCNRVYDQGAPPTCTRSCGGLGIRMCTADAECLTGCLGRCAAPLGKECATDDECETTPLCMKDFPIMGQNTCITDGVTRCTSGYDCACVRGACLGTGRPCSTPADCQLTCEDGSCILGRVCGPTEGLSCVDF